MEAQFAKLPFFVVKAKLALEPVRLVSKKLGFEFALQKSIRVLSNLFVGKRIKYLRMKYHCYLNFYLSYNILKLI